MLSLRCGRISGLAWDAVNAVRTAAAAAVAVAAVAAAVDEDDDVEVEVDVGVTVGRRGNINVARPTRRNVVPNDR